MRTVPGLDSPFLCLGILGYWLRFTNHPHLQLHSFFTVVLVLVINIILIYNIIREPNIIIKSRSNIIIIIKETPLLWLIEHSVVFDESVTGAWFGWEGLVLVWWWLLSWPRMCYMLVCRCLLSWSGSPHESHGADPLSRAHQRAMQEK